MESFKYDSIELYIEFIGYLNVMVYNYTIFMHWGFPCGK